MSSSNSTFLVSSQLTTNIHWPCYCVLSMFMFFIVCLYMYMYCSWKSHRQDGKVWGAINRFNPARLVFMSQTWTCFSNVISSALYCLRSEVFVRFVDIGGIVDHHWLILLFQNTKKCYVLFNPWITAEVIFCFKCNLRFSDIYVCSLAFNI